MHQSILLVFGLIAGASAICLRREQSVGVKGILTCDGKPAANIKLKLYEKDMIKDDFIASARTDSKGYFEFEGTACELSTIDPKLNIYHRCNNGGLGICARKRSITIPDKYVNSGSKAKHYYDLGKHELSGRIGNEGSDCIH